MISKFKPFQGPHQYVFKDPDTGLQFHEKSKKTLMDRIIIYRQQNNLEPLEFLDDVLENYWCSLPENVGRCSPRSLRRGLLGYVKGGVALIKNLMYNSFVSQEEANRRAKICSTCEYNKKPTEAGLALWADMVAYHAVKDHKTDYDDNLFSCELCSCPLKAKCHLSGDLGIKPEVKKLLPDYCWQK